MYSCKKMFFHILQSWQLTTLPKITHDIGRMDPDSLNINEQKIKQNKWE